MGKAKEDNRRKADDALVAACTLYPVKEVMSEYLGRKPLLGTVMAIPVRAAAIGMPAEDVPDVEGFPTDLADVVAIAAGKQSLSRQVWQVGTELGRVTLRLPLGVELDNWESSKFSPRNRADVFVLGCVLDPQKEVVQSWFLKRPLMSQWLSNKLRGWCVGEVEDFNSRQ